MKNKFTKKETDELLRYWIKNSEEDSKTAKSLFDTQRYHHCLFFCHLYLEKMLKALVVKKTNWHALFIHNLLKLAQDAKINLDENTKKDLSTINEFNLRARYNDYKFKFYKKADKKYTGLWFNKCQEIYIWLKKLLVE